MVLPEFSAPASPAQSTDATVYIIGGGVAGLLVAQTLVAASRTATGAVPWQNIVIVERAERLGLGLTQGNGRSLTATEGLVAAGMKPAELDRALVTPVEQGGYAYPGFMPTAADHAQMAQYTAGLRAVEGEIYPRDLALVRFGLANLTQWNHWAKQYPDLAIASGFYLNEKLRIYGGKKAIRRGLEEIDHLNVAGGDCGWSSPPGRLVQYQDALDFDPAMEPYLKARRQDNGQFDGALTLQPGGAIHVGRLVEQLTQRLLATRQVTLYTHTQVQDIQWTTPSAGSSGTQRIIKGLTVQTTTAKTIMDRIQGGRHTTHTLGTVGDRYIFATGFDNLLHRSGAIGSPLFPVAGTSITLALPAPPNPNSLPPCPQRAWKQDLLGPLVFSPTFDTVLDRWILRIGGFKFYPGAGDNPPLDLEHPGVRWSITQQIQQAIAFMPDLMVSLVGHIPADINPEHLLDWGKMRDTLNPWAGLRPLYADGMAALGPFAQNGYAISGTGSWGLSSGIGNAALISQWLQGRSLDQLRLDGIPPPWLQDYLQRVDPLRFD